MASLRSCRSLLVRAAAAGRLRVACVAVLAVAGAAVALTLQPSTAIDTFVSSSSPDYAATQALYREFGTDPVVVLVQDRRSGLLGSSSLATLGRLERCLSGTCGGRLPSHPAAFVYGPATFLAHAVSAVQGEVRSLTAAAARKVRAAQTAARTLAQQEGLNSADTEAAEQAAGELALQREITALGGIASALDLSAAPSLSNTAFVQEIASNPSLAYLFPSSQAAVIQVRLRAGLSDSQQTAAIRAIRAAVVLPRFRIAGTSYTVAGEPVLLSDLGGEVGGQLALLLAVAVAVMALVLLVIFRIPQVVPRGPLGQGTAPRLVLPLKPVSPARSLLPSRSVPALLRLVPLLTALAGLAVTLGLIAVLSGRLTVAEVAVAPVLIGLGVDYGVQFRSGTPQRALASAALASAAGFLALLVSVVPMVRGFGLAMVVGAVLTFALTWLTLRPASAPSVGRSVAISDVSPNKRNLMLGAAYVALIASVRGAGEILLDALALPLRHPRRVLVLAVLLAAAGWALDVHTPVQSDITRLVPAGMPALRHLDTLERVTGSSGQVDVLVSGRDVTSPRVVTWMRTYQTRMATAFGASTSAGTGTSAGANTNTNTSTDTFDCAHATLCPALSLPTLLSGTGGSLRSLPAYFQRAVVTPDHRYALLAFSIRLMPLSRQRRLVQRMRKALDPPSGTTAQLAGLPVLAADAEGSLSSPGARFLLLGVSLAIVALALFVALHRPRRVLVPLVPIVLATGWSALLAYALRIPLNPISATLTTLVVAVSTEFSVLISERVRGYLDAGMTLAQATIAAYRSTGAAVLTSALTAIAGFGVLAASDITMLRDFGVLTLIDLAASLAGVMAVLPATLRMIGFRPRRSSPRPALRR